MVGPQCRYASAHSAHAHAEIEFCIECNYAITSERNSI